MVAGIVLEVSTAQSYVSGGSIPVASESLVQRYLIFPPAGETQAVGIWLSPLQRLLFIAIAGILALTVMMRVVVVEAAARRFGVFGHAVVACFILLCLAIIAIYSHPARGGLVP